MTDTKNYAPTQADLEKAAEISDIKMVRALQYANEWLRYGEQKHATLLALNAATLTALNNLAKPENGDPLHKFLFCTAVVLCAVSVVLSLTSFYARINPDKVLNLNKPPDGNLMKLMRMIEPTKPNWVYFGHLAEQTPQAVVNALVGAYEEKWDKGYLLHMAEQVVINSRLALLKAKRFNTALRAYSPAPVLLILLLALK